MKLEISGKPEKWLILDRNSYLTLKHRRQSRIGLTNDEPRWHICNQNIDKESVSIMEKKNL